MHTWLVKPFNFNSSLTAKQKHFNYRLSRARIVVENAFGRLKARWRRLMKRNDMIFLQLLQHAVFYTIYVKYMENTLMIVG